jgi:hypothetical protein
MDIWIGGVVSPETDAAFRAARTPLVAALASTVGGKNFGAPVDLWSVTPLLVGEAMPFREEAKFRRRARELDCSFALPVAEFLAADARTRVRLLGGLLRRSVSAASDLGVDPLDVEGFMAAIDAAVAHAVDEQAEPA